ncbi:DUF447 family protein [Isosphaeraceae bacterium EP7]
MILEGIVTTLDLDGTLNIAPMGPQVDASGDMARFTLRPFRSSTTYRNLKASGQGVLHVVDDVLLLARAAIGRALDAPTRPAALVNGRILLDACRYYEFRVTSLDDAEERTTIGAETVESGRLRDPFGLNRAKHAVVEAAILATRIRILPLDTILADLDRLAPLVDKTGGPAELAAFRLLRDHILSAAQASPGQGGAPRS